VCSHFFDLHTAVQFSQHHVLKDCFFSVEYSCFVCYRLGDYGCKGLCLDSLSSSIDLYFFFCIHTILS